MNRDDFVADRFFANNREEVRRLTNLEFSNDLIRIREEMRISPANIMRRVILERVKFIYEEEFMRRRQAGVIPAVFPILPEDPEEPPGEFPRAA